MNETLRRQESIDYVQLSRERLAAHQPRGLEAPDLTPAAVLLLLTRAGGQDSIMLTVRSHEVEHHKGQISFPGGGVHAADADLQTTALRETWEEVGIKPDDVEIIGRLDDIVTISHFLVTPFVGVLRHHPYEYVPSPIEVGEIIEPPVRHLLEPANLVWEPRSNGPAGTLSPTYLYGPHRIFGATARMLHGYLNILQHGSGA